VEALKERGWFMSTCIRRGFSLIELLVLIAILGVLMALTAVGVQRARSAALRLSCANNLRQIGPALHDYHGVYRVFPPGVSHPWLRPGIYPFFGPNADPFPLLNWQGRLTPFIEQDALWRRINEAYAEDKYALENPPHSARAEWIRLYICPADGQRLPSDGPHSKSAGTCSYLGVSGKNDVLRDGLFFMDSTIHFAAIKDGTSQTLMVGERPPSADHRWGRWYGGWGGWGMSDAYLGVRESIPGDYYCRPGTSFFKPDELRNPCSRYHFWSFHPGGGNWLFADASVRFLPYTAATSLPAMASRAGGEAITFPE
jgi:prepilin-type N-terminal cleavage/methylation domain-containing protein/prepilin-type processing-associated H-X9-DG protein